MSLATWFRRATVPHSSPRLQSLVGEVVAYLVRRPPDEEIVPKIVGKAIGETELAAMTVLSMLERQGITTHHFGVYCADSRTHLATFDDLSKITGTVLCDACNEQHEVSAKTAVVEIYFTVNREKLMDLNAKRAAA
jgi:hypothetical protein